MAERLPRPDRVEGGPCRRGRSGRSASRRSCSARRPPRRLVRREGVAVWRRMASTGRCSTGWPRPPRSTPTGCCRSGGGGRHPGQGPGHARRPWASARPGVQAASDPPPAAGWLLLVDEGPGETWLYLPRRTTRPPCSTPSWAAAAAPTSPAPAAAPGSAPWPRAAPRAVPGDLRQRHRPGSRGPARRRRDDPGLTGRAGQRKAALAAPGSNPGPWGMGGGGRGWTRGALHTSRREPGRPVQVATPTTRRRGGGLKSSARRRPSSGSACLGIVVIGAAPAGVGGPDREGPPGAGQTMS